MKKIPSLFVRDWGGDRLVRDEVTPGCEWVTAGEGVATRKWDGTCCLVKGGELFKRREVRGTLTTQDGIPALLYAPPAGFISEQADVVTGKVFGWVPVGDGPGDRYHREGWESAKFHSETEAVPEDGTYELVGAKVQGGAEGWDWTPHALVRHGDWKYPDCPRGFHGLKEWLAGQDIEGVVFHHPDGRMAKVKVTDFGLKRGGR